METSDALLPGPEQTRLEIRGARKTFSGTTVLDDVSLAVAPGEIHALIGQNGSGKSTLVKLLSGFHATEGDTEVLVDGTALKLPIRPEALHAAALSFVHQDLGLVESMSVLDNIRVGLFTRRPFSRRIRWGAERAAALATLERLGARVDPDRLVAGLSAAERAVVAIARALQSHVADRGCIVLDECTQALPRETLHEFHAIVADLARRGTSILMVSHRLDEVMSLTDRVSVMRDGRLVATGIATRQTSAAELTRLLLGREPVSFPPRQARAAGAAGAILQARGLTGGRLHGIDLAVSAGEVVGVIGATDSGYEEIPYALAGLVPGVRGSVSVGDTSLDVATADPRRYLEAGLALVPANRAQEGLALSLSVLENLTLPRVRSKSRPMWMARDWQHREYERMADALGIVPRRSDVPVATLSGGNQQKVLLAKWLAGDPRVLVLHEPTQAVDVGARQDVLRAARNVAERGAAVLVSSMAAEDLAAVCDRVLITRHGAVAVELRAPLDVDLIIETAYSG